MWKLVLNLCVVIFIAMAAAGTSDTASVSAQASNVHQDETNHAQTEKRSVMDLVGLQEVAAIERHPAPAIANSETTEFWRVTGSRVNVRGGPSTSDEVLTKLVQDEEVLLIADNGEGWAKVLIQGDGVEGWIATSLLQRTQ
ncbi:SH3 domain-containing protein [Albirhodobacter sp. R86504]|uniref:SH3 domain-containing protein n=1 Tax=Albirhodobacter sp. R86504 TaxID=3093848 RepID=UPI00366BC00F